MTLRAGIYGRNSKGEAKSIGDQLALGRRAVDLNDEWTLAGEYSDDSSASLYRQKDRPDWSRLLADVAGDQLDLLVVWKPARGSRDELDWFPLLRMCANQGVLIHVLADDRTYDPSNERDWRTLADEGVNAAYYARQLSKDVRRGVAASAAAGSPHGRVPFGYDGGYHPETGRPTRTPNADAVIVRELFDRLAKLTPINALTNDFNKRGLASPSGTWHRNTIRTIATNVSYIAVRRHAGEDRPANWPALVDDKTFWQVQEILGREERKTTRPGRAKYLLSYIATGQCGRHLSRRKNRHDGPEYYQCEDGCVSIRLTEADAAVEGAILQWFGRADARDIFARDDERAAAAKAQAARYRVQLEEARQSFESPDGISAEALARRERALLPLIEDADRRARPAGSAGVVDDLVHADDPAQVWARLGTAARREVVALLAKVVLGKPTRRLGKLADPADRAAEAWARLGGSQWAGDDRTWAELAAP